MPNEELWYLLIEGEHNAETGCVGNFYTYGAHLGDALEKTFHAAVDFQFANPNLLEASLLDSFEVIGNNDELVLIATGVYMRPTTYSFPLNDPDKDFIPPTGIVKSVIEGEYAYEQIKENFVAYSADENGIFELELVLTKAHLVDTFMKAIDSLPSVDGFWLYLKNYWENDFTELWSAKHFTTKKQVIAFLNTHTKNTLENGYLDIVVHSLTGETNLTLNDHKKIQLHTKDEALFNGFIEKIMEMGYEQTTDFYNLEFGYHHYHYRPGSSLSRLAFKEMLADNKFELIEKWEE